jgi:hypothetical protein
MLLRWLTKEWMQTSEAEPGTEPGGVAAHLRPNLVKSLGGLLHKTAIWGVQWGLGYTTGITGGLNRGLC